MKFRLPDYREHTPSPCQEFSPFVEDYRLNEHTNELVKTGTVTNKQEQIQSALESTFDKILQKLMPGEVVPEDKLALKNLTRMQDKLDLMTEAYNVAEEYRSKYKLSDDMSPADIFSYVSKQAEVLQTKINDHQKSLKQQQLEKQISDLQNQLKETQNV